MTQQPTKGAISVAYHAFANDGAGGTTYTDDPAQTIGWCAYARTEAGESGEFDVLEEVDVSTETEAAVAATQLGTKYGIDEIEKY